MTAKTFKSEFPILNKRIDGKKIIYFDNACSLLKPRCVIDSVKRFYETLGGCAGGRSAHILSQKTEEACEQAREAVGNFINAISPNEIIWTKNATEGINLIANSFPFKKQKNEVIVFDSEHHSNLLPFYELAKRKRIKLKIAKVSNSGLIDIDSLKKLIDAKTALISFASSSNVLSITQPVKKIASLAHSKGAYIAVDAAQYVTTNDIDVKRDTIDFLAFSGHKIGGPTGIGVLYVRKDLLKKLRPYQVGGGTVRDVRLNNAQGLNVNYLPAPRGWEAGIQHYAGIIGLAQAIKFIQKIGPKTISANIKILTEYLFSRLATIEDIKILGEYNKPPQGSLLSFYFKNKKISLHDFNIFLNHGLDKFSILTRCGHHCASPLHQRFKQLISMRLSFFLYNTTKEIDIFLLATRKYLDMFYHDK